MNQVKQWLLTNLLLFPCNFIFIQIDKLVELTYSEKNNHTSFSYQQQHIPFQKLTIIMRKNSMLEMQTLNRKKLHQQEELDDMPKHVLNNVLNLLGQTPLEQCHMRLPSVSIFYISPLSNITLAYNSLFLFAFYLIQIQIPLIITFGSSFIQLEFQLFGYSFSYWVLFCFFLVDIFVSMNKGFFQLGKGRVCKDQRKIIENYMKGQFIIDIVNVGFLLVPRITTAQNINFLLFIPLILLWVKKLKYRQQIILIFQYKFVLRTLTLLFNLFLDVLLMGHYGACIFAGTDLALWYSQYYGSNTAYYWLSNNTSYTINLMDGPWYFQYIYAQSFSTGTLSTLAPGPFAKNPIEVCFAIFSMTFFMLLASYVAEVLINILYAEQIKRIFHEQNVQDFDKYMTLKKIPETIKTRIYNFFQLVWDVQSRMQTEEQKSAMSLLPLNLREQLLLEMSFVKTFFMFKYIDDSNVLERQLALKINKIIVDSGTCLFQQPNEVRRKYDENSFVLNNIYFLSRGMVKYYISLHHQNRHQTTTVQSEQNYSHNRNQTFLRKKQLQRDQMLQSKNQYLIAMSNSNKFIGLFQFITKKTFSYCCKAVDLCELDTISRKDFTDVIKYTQNDQIYHRLRHEITFENRLEIINKVCSFCCEDHSEDNCPSINATEKIKKEMLTKQGTIGRRQERQTRKNIPYIPSNLKLNKQRQTTQSIKVYHKKKPLLRKKQVPQQIAIFSEILEQSNIKFEDLLMTMSQVEEIQKGFIWKKYYPEYNVDRMNYLLEYKLANSNKIQGSWANKRER